MRQAVARVNLREQHVEDRRRHTDGRTGDAENRYIAEIRHERHIARLRRDAVRDDLRAELPDGGGREVVRVDGHAAREDQEIRALGQIALRGVDDHIEIIVADRHAEDLARIVRELCPHDRLKLIFDPARVNFGAGNDDAGFARMIGPEIEQLFSLTEALGLEDLRLLRDERNNAHRGQPVARLDGEMIRQRGDREVTNRIDLVQKRRIDAEHAARVRHQQNFSLRRLGIMAALDLRHRSHAPRGVLLVDTRPHSLPR